MRAGTRSGDGIRGRLHLQNLNGAFVENSDGVMCQLQEKFKDNDPIFDEVFNDLKEALEQKIASSDIGELTPEQARKSLDLFHIKSMDNRDLKSNSHNNYFPAGGLPQDSVLVVRTDALRDFEQLLSDMEKESGKQRNGSGMLDVERASMLKLILGMAIDRYGFDPDKIRNPATGSNNGSIRAALQKIGLNADEKTISKYLKEAAEANPDARPGKS